jgi:hypothetical protein
VGAFITTVDDTLAFSVSYDATNGYTYIQAESNISGDNQQNETILLQYVLPKNFVAWADTALKYAYQTESTNNDTSGFNLIIGQNLYSASRYNSGWLASSPAQDWETVAVHKSGITGTWAAEDRIFSGLNFRSRKHGGNAMFTRFGYLIISYKVIN